MTYKSYSCELKIHSNNYLSLDSLQNLFNLDWFILNPLIPFLLGGHRKQFFLKGVNECSFERGFLMVYCEIFREKKRSLKLK